MNDAELNYQKNQLKFYKEAQKLWIDILRGALNIGERSTLNAVEKLLSIKKTIRDIEKTIHEIENTTIEADIDEDPMYILERDYNDAKSVQKLIEGCDYPSVIRLMDNHIADLENGLDLGPAFEEERKTNLNYGN